MPGAFDKGVESEYDDSAADISSTTANDLVMEMTHDRPCAEVEMEPPRVLSISPSHGPQGGATTILIHGKNFGTCSRSKLTATIGGVPCKTTRWLSREAAYCLTPPGNGVHLPVQIIPCDCQLSAELASGKTIADTTVVSSDQYRPDDDTLAFFSYDEDVLGQVLDGSELRLKPGVPIFYSRSAMVGEYEVKFVNQATNVVDQIVMEPGLLESLPQRELEAHYGRCAIVGHSGALVGSNLGNVIDGFDAVFRYDGAPTAHRYAPDIGQRTTFQVLSRLWASVLLGNSEDGSHVSRWWLDVATLVLWSPQSVQSYIQLRSLYPNATVMFLSQDLVSSVGTVLQRGARSIEEAGQWPGSWDKGDSRKRPLSSLLLSVAMSLQICKSVELFGVHAKSHRFTYYNDHEPSGWERKIVEYERTMLRAMELAKYIKYLDPPRADPGTSSLYAIRFEVITGASMRLT
eukprot:scaffold2188_cov388-Prasinococcus_capsulatus_cf.AAC.13